MGFSQKRVAYCAGLKTANSLSRYERGNKLPSLINALKLEIVYRTPVAFLFGKLYSKLRREIRNREEKLENKGG
jgi:transcriptional regulator with XRE-family HTH domain